MVDGQATTKEAWAQTEAKAGNTTGNTCGTQSNRREDWTGHSGLLDLGLEGISMLHKLPFTEVVVFAIFSQHMFYPLFQLPLRLRLGGLRRW